MRRMSVRLGMPRAALRPGWRRGAAGVARKIARRGPVGEAGPARYDPGMPWVRRRYRGNKVWVETDEQGDLVLDGRGLARLRYKPEDDRTYSVRASQVLALEDPADPPDEAPPVPPVAPGPRPRRAAARAGDAGPRVAPASDPIDLDVPALAGRELQVWTDGASSGNPGPSGAGAVLLYRDRRKEVSVFLGDTTNNVAELTAVRAALAHVRKRDVPVRVMTDSSYVIGVLTGAMRAKAHRPLIDAIRQELAAFPDLAFVKVEAHAGVAWNERADALAREAIRARASVVRDTSGSP